MWLSFHADETEVSRACDATCLAAKQECYPAVSKQQLVYEVRLLASNMYGDRPSAPLYCRANCQSSLYLNNTREMKWAGLSHNGGVLRGSFAQCRFNHGPRRRPAPPSSSANHSNPLRQKNDKNFPFFPASWWYQQRSSAWNFKCFRWRQQQIHWPTLYYRLGPKIWGLICRETIACLMHSIMASTICFNKSFC